MTEILVAQDGSKGDPGARAIAERLAELEKARVRILQVTSEGPSEAILAAAADGAARLIVMAAHSAGARPASAIDDAALAVLGGAQCPVVLIDPARALGDWALRRMLAPHDGSPSVSAALGPAGELARAAGAEFIVLQVACDERAQEPGTMAPPMYVDQFQHSWPAWSREFLQRLASICPLAGVQVRLLLAHGEPGREAARVAGEVSADLIVLAWKGRWDEPHAATLKALLRDATCPIMVTRSAP